MKILKRDGTLQTVKFDKVTTRIRKLTKGLGIGAPDKIAQQVVSGIYDGITSYEVDNLSAEVAIGMVSEDPEYETLATRIVVSSIQKAAPAKFSDAIEELHDAGVVSDDLHAAVSAHSGVIDDAIQPDRDFSFGYFGVKTLERAYLQRINGKLVETPQYMWMRVALGIFPDDLEEALCVYDQMSRGLYTHATPTLFNSGTPRPQMSSCFLLGMQDDSIVGIYDTIKQCARISKWAGGIGLHCHNIRAKNSKIRGTNGKSDGIIPMLRVLNSTARYVNQAGRRKGSIAIYLEPWHADIMEFLELRLNQGDEEARCRDLFTALWVPDLFMKRVVENGDWTLFCPDEAKGLSDVYGDEFEKLYLKYESEGRGRKTIKAHDVWQAILKSQVETGTPYMLYKDACNKKSNQNHLGTIKSSNLCVEIIEHTAPDEVAVCNLASIALPKFVNKKTFDFKELHHVVCQLTKNLNAVIDRNFYPVEEARRSNMRHRPIGIGVQGLADVFMMMKMPFCSEGAQKLNKQIFETIYHAALSESNRLAAREGTFPSWDGCMAQKGILQFDLWDNVTLDPTLNYDWDALKETIKKTGLRNSLLVAPMPTASTSQILGNNECIEPYTSNIYIRRTLAGEFTVINKHLIKELKRLGLWNLEMKNRIIREGGSVANIEEIPADTRDLFKTVWEMSQKDIINMARDRGAFVCQSQSLNLFVENPTSGKLSSIHKYTWEQGLKTGMYYLRTRSKAKPIQFTLEPTKPKSKPEIVCTDEVCTMCSA